MERRVTAAETIGKTTNSVKNTSHAKGRERANKSASKSYVQAPQDATTIVVLHIEDRS